MCRYPLTIQNGTNDKAVLNTKNQTHNGSVCLGEHPACTWMNDLDQREAVAFIRAQASAQHSDNTSTAGLAAGKPFFMHVRGASFTKLHLACARNEGGRMIPRMIPRSVVPVTQPRPTTTHGRIPRYLATTTPHIGHLGSSVGGNGGK